jgi:hypothetical protein
MVQGIHGEDEGVQGFGVPEARKIKTDGGWLTGFAAFPSIHEPGHAALTDGSVLGCRAQGAQGEGGFFDARTNSRRTSPSTLRMLG